MGILKRAGEILGITAALGGAAEAGQNMDHHAKIVDASKDLGAEVMPSTEQALASGARFAATEAATQLEGGGIEKGPDAKFFSGDTQVSFEDVPESAAKLGDVVAVVRLADGTEKKYVLASKLSEDKGAKPKFDVVAPLDDIEAMNSKLAANQ